MPQVLSKFERPAAAAAVKERRRIPARWNRIKKTGKVEDLSISSIALQPAPLDEDWEKEIQEFSLVMEREKMKSQRPYDPEYELKVAVNEMSLFGIPRAPSPNQDQYRPSAHHVPPVTWIRRDNSYVMGQFVDAEE